MSQFDCYTSFSENNVESCRGTVYVERVTLSVRTAPFFVTRLLDGCANKKSDMTEKIRNLIVATKDLVVGVREKSKYLTCNAKAEIMS